MTDYERYEKLRDIKGLKNSNVARIANIPASTFTDWKKGKSSPKIEKLNKIANALGVTMTDLMGAEKGSPEYKILDMAPMLIKAKEENRVAAFLDKEELNVLKSFRSLDEESQRQVVLMLAFLKEQQNKKG